MKALELITSRQSCRAFKADPIPGPVLKEILDAAGNSPSYTNTQPWEAAVVTGAGRDRLSRLLLQLAETRAPVSPDIPIPENWPPQLQERAQEHGARRLATLGVARDDKEGREELRLMNYNFYGAPCAVFLFMDPGLGEWSLYDMGLFTQNLVLAAHSLGVSTCIQASVTHYAKEIKAFLGLAGEKKLLSCIALGYPDGNARLNEYRSQKKKPAEFVSQHS